MSLSICRGLARSILLRMGTTRFAKCPDERGGTTRVIGGNFRVAVNTSPVIAGSFG